MAEEAADALVEFGGDDVFEFAGLAVSLVVVDAESVFEEALGEAMAADDVAGAAAATVGEFDVAIRFDVDEAEILHAGQGAHGVNATGRANVLDISNITFLGANPDLFE